MASEQNKYYLMHKNDMVAALTLDKLGRGSSQNKSAR